MPNGHHTSSKEGILKTIADFYTELYQKEPTSREAREKILDQVRTKRKPKETYTDIGGLITQEEIYQALSQMKNNKSPGNDGLPKEFYITFWHDIKELLETLYINIYLRGQLTETQKSATIKLLFKKNDPCKLKNWRPVSLLTVDYKILSKVLANRLKPEMQYLIGPDQYCGVTGRSIQHANIILSEIFQKENSELAQGGCYMAIDQEKAFDRIDHEYLISILEAMNISNRFIRWVKILYHDITSKIEVNGAFTEEINIQRSVRQGCPLSMLLFIIGAEGLSTEINENKNIKGYKLFATREKKLIAYADDMTLILTSPNSLSHALESINTFCKASGAKMNQEKTEILRLGPWKAQPFKEALSWLKNKITVLGIIYSENNMQAKNFTPITDTINERLQKWGKRNYTIEGRANILNIYEFPKILYRLNTIDIPSKILEKYMTNIYNFIWKNKLHKIKKDTITKPKELGGIGLFNIKKRQEAYTIKTIIDCIEKPDEDHAVLIRRSIGFIPTLENKIRQLGKIKYATGDTTTNKQRREILKNFATKEEIKPGLSMKEIYYKIMNQENKEIPKNQIAHLNRIKNSKLWETGYYTVYNAHSTRDWLYRHIPNSAPTNLCGKCRKPQTLQHIIKECNYLLPLREHIEKNYHKIKNYQVLSEDNEQNKIRLLYQKLGLAYVVRQNISQNRTDIVREFEEAMVKYNMT